MDKPIDGGEIDGIADVLHFLHNVQPLPGCDYSDDHAFKAGKTEIMEWLERRVRSVGGPGNGETYESPVDRSGPSLAASNFADVQMAVTEAIALVGCMSCATNRSGERAPDMNAACDGLSRMLERISEALGNLEGTNYGR